MKVRFTDDTTTFAGVECDQLADAFDNTVTSVLGNRDRFDSSELEWEPAAEDETYDHVFLYANHETVEFTQREAWETYHDWLRTAADVWSRTLNAVLD